MTDLIGALEQADEPRARPPRHRRPRRRIRRPLEANRASLPHRLLVILAAVFGVTVGIAELAGAANLGVSFGIGQVAFAIALVVLLTRD